MKRLLAWRTTGIGLALLLVSSTCLAFETVTSRHIKTTTLVFKQAELSNPLFPVRFHSRNLQTVFSSQLKFSCQEVRRGPSGLLAFLPELNQCSSLEALQRTNIAGQKIQRGVAQDKRMLQTKLESNLLLVMQPMVQAQAIQGACVCPDVEPPELIFFDSFETGL